jgi:hypothetical protein
MLSLLRRRRRQAHAASTPPRRGEGGADQFDTSSHTATARRQQTSWRGPHSPGGGPRGGVAKPGHNLEDGGARRSSGARRGAVAGSGTASPRGEEAAREEAARRWPCLDPVGAGAGSLDSHGSRRRSTCTASMAQPGEGDPAGSRPLPFLRGRLLLSSASNSPAEDTYTCTPARPRRTPARPIARGPLYPLLAAAGTVTRGGYRAGSARYGSARYGSARYGSLRYRAESLARLGSFKSSSQLVSSWASSFKIWPNHHILKYTIT